MNRQELVAHARSQIDQLKKAGVPKLMQEKNVEALKKILESFDYSAYENCRKPKFKIKDLVLDCEETVLATVFYVFGNPYLKYGDGYFFSNSYYFRDVLRKISKPWARRLIHIIYGEEENVHYLNMYCKDGITLPQLVGLEEIT